MMLLSNNFKKPFFFLLFIFTLLSLSGCSTMTMMINNQVDISIYEKQLKKPTAKKYHLIINKIKRNFFLLNNNKGTDNTSNKRLTLILSGSGCLDAQPLLGLQFQNIAINSDIVVLQKRGVQEGSNTMTRLKCTKHFYMHNNHVNRTRDNLSLIQHLLKKNSYKRITLLGVSEGVQIAYLMMNKNSALNEAVLLANHAANSIKGAYDAQALFRDKTDPGALKRYRKLHNAIKQKGKDNHYEYGNYVKSWRTTFNSDKRNMGEVLSMKKNNRYLFIMGDNDEVLPSKKLKQTKKIFCRNKHSNNLILYKNNSDHAILLRPSRFLIHKVIADWMDKKPYQKSTKFTRLSCE